MLPLFGTPEVAGRPRIDFARCLHELAVESVYIGTSSWKYADWLGSIYSEDRYRGRQAFSKRSFDQTCITEYAETFRTVGGDFSFYRFYEAPFWDHLFSQVPEGFKFGLKVPQEITTRVWPKLDRHGALAGHRNPAFLDVALFQEQFTDILRRHQDRIGVLMFEFGEFSRADHPSGVHDFVEDLGPFLEELPAGFRYAVEVRNAEFLAPRYFDCLRRHNVAHVFSSWTRMPPLSEQLAIAEADSADFLVCRALLRPGRTYRLAVKRFEPYRTVQDLYPEGRAALTELVQRARKDRRVAFIFVNNRFEGNAPGTIAGIVEDL